MIREIAEGAVAGVGATAPMTALMKVGTHWLPAHERQPLPPRQITATVGRNIGIWRHLSQTSRNGLTLAGHYSYGGAMGALYGAIARGPQRNCWTGAAFGLAVWAGSYLGWLPAVGLHEGAAEEHRKRNALMIAAHLVWGAAVGQALAVREEYAPDEGITDE